MDEEGTRVSEAFQFVHERPRVLTDVSPRIPDPRALTLRYGETLADNHAKIVIRAV